MKTIKISLAVIVVTAITFFVIRSFVSTDKVGEIQETGNPFIDKIKAEIKVLQLKPDSGFCKDYYSEVTYHIDDYHKNSRLGKSSLENNKWKENLSNQLYAAYADKFIKQAYNVFNGSDWKNEDLNFIRVEYQILQNSPFLERGSPIDQKFDEFRSILKQYDVIARFIASCRNFTYSKTGLSDRFPIADVQSNISQSERYLISGLGNSYVSNCARLRNELDGVSNVLFLAQVRYLDNKINSWSGLYTEYNSQKTYADNLYTQLANEIEELDNDIYKSPDFNVEYLRLKRKWETDAQKAYVHFNKKL